MHKIIADTNVIISSILGRSYPYLILHKLILQHKVQVYLSYEIIGEAERVVGYKKFAKINGFQRDAEIVLNGLKVKSVIVNPPSRVELLTDPSDNKFLDLALSVSADFLITGNIKHFPFNRLENTEIISPEKYWNTYWK